MDGLKERLHPLSSQTFLSMTQIRVWWPPRDPSLKQCMKKILIVRMIFGSKLLSSFAVSHLRVSAIYTLFSSIYATERQAVVTRDAGTGVHDGGTAPCPMKRGATGAQVS